MATSTQALAMRLAPVLIACLAFSGCRTAPPTPPAPETARNLVIITIDTLRADRVGVYGAANVATPHMDRIAREGAYAANATVHVPLTRPSHISLFTGLHPAEHGIRDNVAPALPEHVQTLAQTAKAHGFATAAFVSSIVLGRQSGLARGFDHYSDQFDISEDDARFLNTIQKRGDGPTDEAVAWIREHSAGRFFAWLHLYDPHDPYEPPGRYAATYADRPYDGEVAWSDELVGRIMSALGASGVADQTLVLVTSDHGEGLGEHGEAVHGYFVYESTLRVPLMLRGPGVSPGTRIEALARTVDVLPTLHDLLGLPAVKTSGRTLAPALRGERIADEPSFAESLTPLVHYGWSDLRAVRDGRWKYILAPRPELYDLDRDPGELTNLHDREPARARAMRGGLEARLRAEQTSSRSDDAAAAIPPDLLEKLGALGYVSPGGTAAGNASGADPKDKLEEYKTLNTLMRQGLVALRERRFAESAGHFRGLRTRGVESFEVHYYLGRALSGLRRWRDAAAEYQKAADRLPAYAPAWRGLAESRVALSDLPGAAQALEKAVSLSEKDALSRVRLGEVYRDMGRPADAIRVMREAVAIEPRPASYWNSLGMVLGGVGQMADAERAFAEAHSRDAAEPQYAYNRGLALQRLGRGKEAVDMFRRAAALGFPPAKVRLAELGAGGQP